MAFPRPGWSQLNLIVIVAFVSESRFALTESEDRQAGMRDLNSAKPAEEQLDRRTVQKFEYALDKLMTVNAFIYLVHHKELIVNPLGAKYE